MAIPVLKENGMCVTLFNFISFTKQKHDQVYLLTKEGDLFVPAHPVKGFGFDYLCI